ncbi:hypothetical protein GIB67_003010 [Kingdonia uniflora]|uniref:Uncharacterized protein n=1 Tax=Kingdonia uniflora TaxID=39325 RepID=A0A7J7LYJ5_9MAGN|nr:hypothetical protein GIB67_003010 [Kingdonia uniflora]
MFPSLSRCALSSVNYAALEHSVFWTPFFLLFKEMGNNRLNKGRSSGIQHVKSSLHSPRFRL